jgi:UDP-glucose 4-epimerase
MILRKVALLKDGFEVVVVDNLCNASLESLRRVTKLAGRAPVFVEGDVRDRALLDKLLIQHQVKAALHYAGLEAVGESLDQPLRYYGNNLSGTITLCQAMAEERVSLPWYSVHCPLCMAMRLRFPSPKTSWWVTRLTHTVAANSWVNS